MRLRALKGLGDAIYAYPIVKHFAKSESVTICTQYPEVFRYLEGVTTTREPHPNDIVLRYTREPGSNQYRDVCDIVGVYPEFKFEWPPMFLDVEKPVCIIKEPSTCHMNKRTGDMSLAPNVEEIQNWVDAHKDQYYFVSVGKDEVFKGRLQNIDRHLVDQISVSDLLGLCSGAAAIATQIGHLVPIAQAMGKPLKIFEPESLTDPRLLNMSVAKVRVDGVENEIP